MSQKSTFIIIGVAVFLIMGFLVLWQQIPNALAEPTSIEETSRNITRYLSFQVFIGALDPRVPIGGSGINPLSPPPSKVAISEFVQDIIDRIGIKGNKQTKLAFIEGPFSFDHSDSDISRVMGEAFEVALEKDIAVGFHIDDSMFWARRSDLWRDQNNIEWLDWDGTVNTGRKIDWGQPVKLAPQMCFNSKAIQAEVRRRATDVIGKAIKQGIDKLKQEGKEELFAGVIVGWETQIGRDFDTNKFLGYCALTNRSFNKNNPPQDLDSEREKVVQEFIELWAKGIFDAGINPDKIYSHTAFVSKKVFDIAKPSEAYSALNGFAPPSVAFGSYHNPGFSTYPQTGLTEQIYEELAAHNNPHWASCEGTNLQLGYGPGESGMNMETYLAKMFNHGAILVNIFAWGIGGEDEEAKNSPFRIVTEGKESIDAYRKFLKGEELIEQISSPPFSMETLAAKVQKVQKEVPAWVQRTGNQAKVEPLLQRLDQYIKEPNPREAERVADEILELIGSKSLVEEQQINTMEQYITIPKLVKLDKIPSAAELVYYQDGLIYVMDRNGGNVTQITFSPHTWEHVAVSPDRRFVVGNEQLNDDTAPLGRSLLWLYDLQNGTEQQLVPGFHQAGSGGVDWDPQGYIYFQGRPSKIKGALSPKLIRDNVYASDHYKIKYDGTGLTDLTNTPDSGEFDISTSKDGSMIVYVRLFFDLVTATQGVSHTELWVANSDGSNQRLVYRGGQSETAGVFDPEFSDDTTKIAFSQVNSWVPPNFPNNPAANTAHDIWTINLDGTNKTRMTQPGPISIIPDWNDHQIIYHEINERNPYNGASVVNADGTSQRRIKLGAQFSKWIPAEKKLNETP